MANNLIFAISFIFGMSALVYSANELIKASGILAKLGWLFCIAFAIIFLGFATSVSI